MPPGLLWSSVSDKEVAALALNGRWISEDVEAPPVGLHQTVGRVKEWTIPIFQTQDFLWWPATEEEELFMDCGT